MKYGVFLIVMVFFVSFLIFGCFTNHNNNTPDNQTPKNNKTNETWINELIKKQLSEPPANPPATLSRCQWKDQIVYYLPPRCCDIQSELYDKKGNLICRPDGGIAGNGDGKCPDFIKKNLSCEIIWTDPRAIDSN